MNISLPQFFRHTSIFFWVKSRQIYYSFINIYLFLLSLRLVDHSKSLTRLQSNTVFTGRNSLFHLKGLCSCAVHGPRMFETVCAWNLDWIGFKYLKKRGVHELCFFFFNYCLLLILILADGAISQAQPSTCTCSDIWNNFQVMSSHTLVHPSIPFFCSPLLLPPPHPTHSAYPFLSIPTPPSLPYLCSIPPLPSPLTPPSSTVWTGSGELWQIFHSPPASADPSRWGSDSEFGPRRVPGILFYQPGVSRKCCHHYRCRAGLISGTQTHTMILACKIPMFSTQIHKHVSFKCPGSTYVVPSDQTQKP